MKRFVGNDSSIGELKGYGGVARKRRDGTFHLSDSDAKAFAATGSGFVIPDMGPGRRNEGYRCTECGFGSWFKTCSKCGGECLRETET